MRTWAIEHLPTLHAMVSGRRRQAAPAPAGGAPADDDDRRVNPGGRRGGDLTGWMKHPWTRRVAAVLLPLLGSALGYAGHHVRDRYMAIPSIEQQEAWTKHAKAGDAKMADFDLFVRGTSGQFELVAEKVTTLNNRLTGLDRFMRESQAEERHERRRFEERMTAEFQRLRAELRADRGTPGPSRAAEAAR